MRRACLWAVTLISVVVLSACSLLHKPASTDAGLDAEPPSPPVEDVSARPVAMDSGTPSRPSGPVHAHGASGCAGNLVAVLADAGAPPECVLECVSDPGCPQGMFCGARAPLSANGKPGKTIEYCEIGHRPPGGKADAGPTAPVVVDAGAAPPAKRLDVRKSAAGCPAGYAACGAACRLICKSVGDCGAAGAHCTDGLCEGPGALPCK